MPGRNSSQNQLAGWISGSLAFFLTIAVAAQQTGWRGFRGNDGSGSFTPHGLLATQSVDLELTWKRALGSGYSGIVVRGNRLYTAYCDDRHDRLICMNSVTGATQWDIRLGPRHAGRNGSFDGPLATPVVAGDSVVMLTAAGELIACDTGNGQRRWSQWLTRAPLHAPPPLYGFSSSPIVVDDTVIVLAGGPGAFAAGFDLHSGRLVWKSGDDEVQAQSAIYAQVAGKGMVVAAGMHKLLALDPPTGKLWFQVPHEGRGARGALSIVPVVVGSNRLLIAHDDHASRLYEVIGQGNEFEARPLWTTTALANSYNVPVWHDGILFGYRDRILTAVDPATGRRLYRSRQPGEGFHIAIDGHLVLITRRGDVHLARTDRTGFRSRSWVSVFEDLVWTPPSYAENAIYVRSLAEIARVDLVLSSGGTAGDKPEDMPMAPRFEKAIAAIKNENRPPQRRTMIDQFVARHAESPYIDEGIAHFYYRGPANDVAIASPIFGARQARRMSRIDDLFFYAVVVPADQRADYSLFIDYQSQSDPRNPRPSFVSSVFVDEMEIKVSTTRAFSPVHMSWFAMPQWRPPEWLPTGEIDFQREMSGESVEHELGDGSRVTVYLPPGYATQTDRYATLYVFAPEARTAGKLDRWIDRLIVGGRIRPCLVVFLQPELGQPKIMDYPQYLTEMVIPGIDAAFRTRPEAKHRISLATGFYTPLAMYVATQCADLIGGTGMQSPYILGDSAEEAARRFARLEVAHRVYCEWGRFDLHCPTENWDMRSAAENLFKAIESNPLMEIDGGPINDTTGWKSWQLGLERVLTKLLK